MAAVAHVFGLRDASLVQRLQRSGALLDLESAVLEPASPLTAALQAEALLGWDLTCSWLIGQLQQPGVHKVELLSPTTDQRVAPKQAVVVHDVTLTLAGRDR